MKEKGSTFGDLSRDIRLGIKALRGSFPFIRKHRLWEGVLSYGWLSRFFIVVGLIAGLKFFSVLVSWATNLQLDSPQAYGASVLDLYSKLFEGGFFLFSLGGMKYLILILTEVFLFHVVRRSLEILKGEHEDTSLKAFMQAQIRMIKVSALAWASELVVGGVLSIGLGIAGAEWLKSPLGWLVQCFFLGAVVLDNYFEFYKIPVKESMKRILEATGVAIVVGIATYVLLSVPLVGAILAPFCASITATLALFEMETKGWIHIPDVQSETL